MATVRMFSRIGAAILALTAISCADNESVDLGHVSSRAAMSFPGVDAAAVDVFLSTLESGIDSWGIQTIRLVGCQSEWMSASDQPAEQILLE